MEHILRELSASAEEGDVLNCRTAVEKEEHLSPGYWSGDKGRIVLRKGATAAARHGHLGFIEYLCGSFQD